MPDEGRIRGLFAVSTMHGVVAPRAVVIGGNERTGGIQKGNDIALRVEDVVVELRCLAVLVDHGERLVAIVVHELEGLHRLVNRIVAVARLPLLAHDLAGERGIGIGRRALVGGRVDLLAAADTGHVVGIGDLLAVHRCGGELAALRPREGIVLAVVVRDRVAGGRKVARPGLALVENVLGRTVCRHAREQIRPRGIRVAEGLCDRAVLRNAPNVARRVVGAAAQRDAAGNDDDLWLCADGCTHHSDHLSIFLRWRCKSTASTSYSKLLPLLGYNFNKHFLRNNMQFISRKHLKQQVKRVLSKRTAFWNIHLQIRKIFFHS